VGLEAERGYECVVVGKINVDTVVFVDGIYYFVRLLGDGDRKKYVLSKHSQNMENARYAADYGRDSDGERIQAAIDDTSHSGPRTVIVEPTPPGEDREEWLLEEALELPSYTTLVLVGATIRLIDGANDNILRNADFDDGNSEIHVAGIGQARLDGNAENQKRHGEQIYETFGIHFYNVDTITLTGITVGPTECWGICLENVLNVRVSDIAFAQDGATPNQDGLHITGPAEQITVSGITGTCGDDAVIARSGLGLYGSGGDLRGMTVTNVSVQNVHSTGIFRTVAASGCVIDGVYASNLYLNSTTEAGDSALKIGWNGPESAHREVKPAEHRNIVVENVGVNRWDGNFCTIQQPVQNLTIRNATARHTGAFLYNEENDIDGLTLENCRSALIGSPPETLVNEFYRELLEGGLWIPSDYYFGGVVEEPPGAITFDRATVSDVMIRDVSLESTADSNDKHHPTGFRITESATIDGLQLSNSRIAGYQTGINIEANAAVSALSIEQLRQTDVEIPWNIESDEITIAAHRNEPARYIYDRIHSLEAGEESEFSVEIPSHTGLDPEVTAVPLVQTDRHHGYQTDLRRRGDDLYIHVKETVEDTGGTVRVRIRC
jgi:hypothetical protein